MKPLVPLGTRHGIHVLLELNSSQCMRWAVNPIDESRAGEIAGWHYATPYDFYDWTPAESEQCIKSLMAPENCYYAGEGC